MTVPTLKVEVAFTTGADTGTLLQLDDPSRGKLDTGTLGSGAADEPIWTDISPYLLSGNIRRGSTRVNSPIIEYESGVASLRVLNLDRRFDPMNLDGPYVDTLNGTTRLTAMRAIRVRAEWNSVSYGLFRGFVDNWDVSWIDPSYSECLITATDGFKVFAGNDDRPAVAPVGAGELTSARINRILDDLGWPASDRLISTGDSTVQATTLEGDALGELQLVAASEVGDFYMNGDGLAVFRSRNDLFTDVRSNTAQALFGDAGGAELPYHDLGISADDTTFANKVRIAIAGGTDQIAVDATSVALFYPKMFSKTDLILQTDAAALDVANWILYVSKDPELRFDTMSIKPKGDPANLYPQVLGREFGDRIEILRRPPGGGDPIDKDVFIRGVEHTFAPEEWLTTWVLQSAERYGSFLTFDHAELGLLDQNALSF